MTASTPTLQRFLDRLQDHGCKVKGGGRNWHAQCPAHEDNNPSLSVGLGNEGRVLVHCHAGCTFDDIIATLGLAPSDLSPEDNTDPDDTWTPCGPAIAMYRYEDENGTLLYTVCRTADKKFRVWRPDPTSKTGRRWEMGDVRRVLYRLPKVVAHAAGGGVVFVVEGEKDVHTLEQLGFVATCNHGGEGVGWRPEYSPTLAGADVVILPDNDEAGRRHAKKVAASVADHAATVKMVELPGVGEHGDASDWVAAGGTRQQLEDLVRNAPLYDPATRPADGEAAQPPRPALEFVRFADLAAQVDADGPRRWLIRGIWPAGDYGVHAAEAKAQKTWNSIDLAVSVATGTPWLGTFPIDTPGPVIVFHGEGGRRGLVRRVRAILADRNLDAGNLPLEVCVRAPHLNNDRHLAEFAARVEQVRPALVVLDPLYLAASGANLRDLYEMGALLERAQHICGAVGASLFVVTHFNRQKGSGQTRITGAGPTEWGRVLVTATVKARHTDPDSRATDVITELDIIGGEIPDRTVRVRRHITADDPDDLDSPLHVTVTATEQVEGGSAADGDGDLPPAARKLLEALSVTGDSPATITELVDRIAERHGHGLRRETVSRTLNDLEARGLVESVEQGAFNAKLWVLTDAGSAGLEGRKTARSRGDHAGNLQNRPQAPCDPRDITRDITAGAHRVTSVTAPIGGHTSRGPQSHDDRGDPKVTRERPQRDSLGRWPCRVCGRPTEQPNSIHSVCREGVPA